MRHDVGMARDSDERWRAAVRGDDTTELLSLGCELVDDARLEAAVACFRRASELGSAAGAFNLGNALAEQELWLEAVPAFEVALERGETDAWVNLGLVLHELGDLAGEMRAYEQAEAAGDSGGPLGLAFSLREQGDLEGAMSAAQRSADMGNETAKAVVACWQWCLTLDPSLEGDLRAGAELFAAARADLGDLLRSSGRIEEARDVLEGGMASGEVESMLPLGNLYADVLGDVTAARAAYSAAADLGDAHAHHNLGVLLEEAADVDGALHHYRLAVAGGDVLASSALARLQSG